jgi:hypothetical protein
MGHAAPSPLVVVRPDGPVVVVRRLAGEQRELELAAHGWWPTWNRLGEVALSHVETVGESLATLEVFDVRDPALEPRIVSRTTPAALIAPRTPHYALWSDDGATLCYVTPSEDGLGVFTALPGDATSPVRLATGAPMFPAWEPGGPRLALHHGATLTVLEPGSPRQTIISERAVGFRTPAFRDDGRILAFAEPAGAGVVIATVDPDGTERQPIAHEPGGVALAFRPSSRELALAVSRTPEMGVFDELAVVDSVSRGRRRLHRGPFVAFWWSPAGDRVAVLVPAQTGDGRYQLHIISAEGSVLASAEPIVLSQDLRTVVSFFDQYALSHRLWSPDGSSFALCGRLVSDGVASSFGDPPGDAVYTWAAFRGAPLERLGHGVAAFYPPPAAAPFAGEVNEG